MNDDWRRYGQRGTKGEPQCQSSQHPKGGSHFWKEGGLKPQNRRRTTQPKPLLGLEQVSVQLSPETSPLGQAPVMPSERPTVWHWRSRLEQTPLAHSRPPPPPPPVVPLVPPPAPPPPPPVQAVPSGTVASSGQVAAEPVHMSARSHSPTEGRQTVVDGLKVQLASQQTDEAGSHTAPLRKRQAVRPEEGAKGVQDGQQRGIGRVEK